MTISAAETSIVPRLDPLKRFLVMLLRTRQDMQAEHLERLLVGRRGSVIVWVVVAAVAVSAAAWWMLVPQEQPGTTKSVAKSDSSPARPASATKVIGQPSSKDNPGTIAGASVNDVQHTDIQPVSGTSSVTKAVAPPAALEPAASASLSAILPGSWTSYFQGQRKLKMNADGTGTMVAHPEGIAATLLAPELKFDIRWSVDDGQLNFETLGGEPLDKVNVIVRMYGRKRTHKILAAGQDQITLLDEDGVTKYVWKRVPSGTANSQDEKSSAESK